MTAMVDSSTVDSSTVVLEAKGLGKKYRDAQGGLSTAVEDVSFAVSEGEFVCVVGPSGCGKTTLLKMLSGLMGPTTGEVRFRDVQVKQPPRDLALVFQDYTRSLLPWLSVEDNVALPLEARGVDRTERRKAAREALDMVGLSDYGHRSPWEMSGGMQQRAAIARAVVSSPKLLLMDEPFASVDAQTRATLEDLVARLFGELGIPTVLVTHDIDEAVYLADRVVVLSKRPSVVRKSIPIHLERPRDQLRTRASQEFIDYRTTVLSMIRDEGATA